MKVRRGGGAVKSRMGYCTAMNIKGESENVKWMKNETQIEDQLKEMDRM